MDEFQITSHNPRDYEETDNVDWQALRNQYAGMAMQGLLSTQAYSNVTDSYEYIAKDAVEQADALIEELKKK